MLPCLIWRLQPTCIPSSFHCPDFTALVFCKLQMPPISIWHPGTWAGCRRDADNPIPSDFRLCGCGRHGQKPRFFLQALVKWFMKSWMPYGVSPTPKNYETQGKNKLTIEWLKIKKGESNPKIKKQPAKKWMVSYSALKTLHLIWEILTGI